MHAVSRPCRLHAPAYTGAGAVPRLMQFKPTSALSRFIGLGFTTCALVGGTLSPEFRKAQPGAFAALYS